MADDALASEHNASRAFEADSGGFGLDALASEAQFNQTQLKAHEM